MKIEQGIKEQAEQWLKNYYLATDNVDEGTLDGSACIILEKIMSEKTTLDQIKEMVKEEEENDFITYYMEDFRNGFYRAIDTIRIKLDKLK